jgi:hypothetical protein
MSFIYTPAKQKLAKGDADFDTLDVRAILVMSNTTADTDQDAANIAAIGTLDEYDGSGYSRPDLGSSTITQDDANNRSEIDYADFTFGATVAAGTRQAVGMIIYVEVGTDSQDWPIAYIDTGGFPFDGSGAPINVAVNTEALLQVA